MYLSGPDGNGLELYYDRPRKEWFDRQGDPILKTKAFRPYELLVKPEPRSQVEVSQSLKED